MRNLIRLVVLYFALTGLALHLSALAVYLFMPGLVYKVQERVAEKLGDRVPLLAATASTPPVTYDLESELQQVLPPWRAQPGATLAAGEIRIGSQPYPSLQQAAQALKNGDTLLIGPGTYEEAFVVKASNVSIIGHGAVHIRNATVGGKGAIVVKGQNTLIRNLEISGVSVKDRNGACVRLEGQNLMLEHVYFHDSDQGVLTGNKAGIVRVHDSRFVKLGRGGRAHGIYMGGGELLISNSIFAAARGEGHEIKSRAAVTEIRNSLVTSLSSNDSRLVDVSNGGRLVIADSVLHQGPGTRNGDLIGFALEKKQHPQHELLIYNNTVIMERTKPNYFVHAPPATNLDGVRNNVLIGRDASPVAGSNNTVFSNRQKAGLGPYPALPARGAGSEGSTLQWQ